MERAFIARLHDETLALLLEAREQAARGPARSRRDLPPEIKLAVVSQRLRLTSHLARIVAWILVRRAVAAGELSPDSAEAEKRDLAAHAPPAPPAPADCPYAAMAEAASTPLQRLSGRIRGHYARVLRMEGIDPGSAHAAV